MGAKAKQAIAEAQTVIKEMNDLIDDFIARYQQIATESKERLTKKLELSQYAGEHYKGDDNFRDHAKDDPKMAEMIREIEESGTRIRQLEQMCVHDYEEIREGQDRLTTVLQKLQALIDTKQAKRDKKTNVIKKLVNLTKTKSLGDLKTERDRIWVAFDRVRQTLDRFPIKSFLSD
jgi:hypothetical protein